jgi:signal transduction histidine kinase
MTESDLGDRERALLDWAGGSIQVLVHDARNHFTRMLGEAQMMAWKIGVAPNVPPEAVKDISDRSERIVQAVRECDEMLARFQLIYRRQVISPVAVPLTDLLEATLNGLSTQESERVTSGTVPEIMVAADRQRLPGAFRECIRNALRATAPDSKATVEVTVNGPTATIAIRDEGIGMTPEQMENACMPFYSAWPDHRGCGIGLTSVDRFVTACGGTVSFESEGEGRGTTARIDLPLAGGPTQLV